MESVGEDVYLVHHPFRARVVGGMQVQPVRGEDFEGRLFCAPHKKPRFPRCDPAAVLGVPLGQVVHPLSAPKLHGLLAPDPDYILGPSLGGRPIAFIRLVFPAPIGTIVPLFWVGDWTRWVGLWWLGI